MRRGILIRVIGRWRELRGGEDGMGGEGMVGVCICGGIDFLVISWFPRGWLRDWPSSIGMD